MAPTTEFDSDSESKVATLDCKNSRAEKFPEVPRKKPGQKPEVSGAESKEIGTTTKKTAVESAPPPLPPGIPGSPNGSPLTEIESKMDSFVRKNYQSSILLVSV